MQVNNRTLSTKVSSARHVSAKVGVEVVAVVGVCVVAGSVGIQV